MWDASEGQEAVEAKIASMGYIQTCHGSGYVFQRQTGEKSPVDMSGPDWTGTGATGGTKVLPVVEVFEYEALRDEEYNLVCAVPGHKRHGKWVDFGGEVGEVAA